MLKTVKAKSDNPMRIMIYGQEGVGKSTFGAMSENPIFISAEGGIGHLKNKKGELLDEMPNMTSIENVSSAIGDLTKEDHGFKTLVIDSADWVEQLVHAHIIGASGKSMATVNGGYGAGFRESEKIHMKLIQSLDNLSKTKGMHIVVIAHSHVKPIKDPDIAEDYNAHEIKCHEYVSALWRQWVDVLGFARFFAAVSGDNKTKRVISDGSRLLYLAHEPAMQAKNRYSIPSPIEFTPDAFDIIKSYWQKSGNTGQDVESLTGEIKDLLKTIKDQDIVKKVEANLIKFKDNALKLETVKQRLIAITKEK